MRHATALLLLAAPAAVHAASVAGTQIADRPATGAADVPLGIEVVTGYRSEYVYRGFLLGRDVLEVQLETEISLSNQWSIGLGAWYASETGDGEFTETTAFTSLTYRTGQWEIGGSASYHAYDHSLFQDGCDLGLHVTWRPSDDWSFTTGVYYDTGADAWYGKLEGMWSKPTGNHSFVTALAGASCVSGYYGRDGGNDAYGRLAWTYAFNDRVSITPFVGTSLTLDSDEGHDRLFGGLWFEVNF